jgi:hypothetical protein
MPKARRKRGIEQQTECPRSSPFSETLLFYCSSPTSRILSDFLLSLPSCIRLLTAVPGEIVACVQDPVRQRGRVAIRDHVAAKRGL